MGATPCDAHGWRVDHNRLVGATQGPARDWFAHETWSHPTGLQQHDMGTASTAEINPACNMYALRMSPWPRLPRVACSTVRNVQNPLLSRHEMIVCHRMSTAACTGAVLSCMLPLQQPHVWSGCRPAASPAGNCAAAFCLK